MITDEMFEAGCKAAGPMISYYDEEVLRRFYRAARALEPQKRPDTGIVDQAWRLNAGFGNASLR